MYILVGDFIFIKDGTPIWGAPSLSFTIQL